MSQRGSTKKRGATWTAYWRAPDGRQRTKGGFKTKTGANEHLTEVLGAIRQTGTYSEPSKMALAAYLREEWLPTLLELKPTTRQGYSNLVESYIVPTLGEVRLCDLTAGRITRLYDHLRVNGRVRGSGGLSEASVHHVHVALTAALGHAVEARLLPVSPMTQIPKKQRPKSSAVDAEKAEMRVWSAEEAQRFLGVAAGHRLGPVFDLALNTGLRRGELVGLRWADVDLERAQLAVRRSRTVAGRQVVDGTPKSRRARTIDLDEGTVAMLRRWRARQLEERLAWGPAWVDSGLVFTREDGTPLRPETPAYHLVRLARAAGVPEIRLHDLRHTHATLGLAAGVPAKVMQERLGHSSIQITLDLYSHVVPGMQADAAARIGALLRPAEAR